MLRQLSHDPSTSVLIENNGVTPDWGCIPFSSNSIVTACKQSLRRLCFYTCLSVILFKGGMSASVHAGIHTPLGRHAPLGQTPPPGRPAPQCMLGDTGNKGRYASYWNAYLFSIRTVQTGPKGDHKRPVLHCQTVNNSMTSFSPEVSTKGVNRVN